MSDEGAACRDRLRGQRLRQLRKKQEARRKAMGKWHGLISMLYR